MAGIRDTSPPSPEPIKDVPVGATIWSSSRLVDADGPIQSSLGGTVVDSWVDENGELCFKVAYPLHGRVQYATIELSDVDQRAYSGIPNPRSLKGLAQLMREQDAKEKTDRHLASLLVLSNVLAKISPRRNISGR